LRCQAQLELTLMMCLSDRFAFTSAGALCDRSTFTSTDARMTNRCHFFFARMVVLLDGVVCAEQTEKNGQGQLHFPLEKNTLPMPLVGVCVFCKSPSSPPPPIFSNAMMRHVREKMRVSGSLQ
jgi:hypothetical protein